MNQLPVRRPLLTSVALLAVLALGIFYWRLLQQNPTPPPPQQAGPFQTAPLPALTFVGRAACAGCHAEQDRLWQGSHHDLAMQTADGHSVLGNFDNAEFSKDGVRSRFFRRDGRFIVNTDGPDGKLADFEVKYTFGVTPLQQYLVQLPGGRLQALPLTWDSRPNRAETLAGRRGA